MVFLINLTVIPHWTEYLKHLLSSFLMLILTLFCFEPIYIGKGMNFPPRVGLNLSKLNFILSICVRTNPLSEASNTSAWCSMSVAIWFKTFVISSSLVISYLLLLTSLLTTSFVFLLLKLLKVCNKTFIPLCFLKYSFILKSWYFKYWIALTPLTLMSLMA